MDTSTLRKRFWLTLGIVTIVPCLIFLCIKQISPLVSYQFNASTEDMTWTNQEAWLLYRDNDGNRLITPQGEVLKKTSGSNYLSIRLIDQNITALITSTNNTEANAEQVELILQGQIVPLVLPSEVFYVNHLSLSPDKEYLLLHGLEKHQENTNFYFTHQAWVRNQATQAWTQIADQETTAMLRDQHMAVEWVANDPHTIFLQLQQQYPQSVKDLSRFTYDAGTLALLEFDLQSSYGPLKKVPSFYGQLDPANGSLHYNDHQIGRNSITFTTEDGSTREVLHWWNLGLNTERPFIGSMTGIMDLGDHKLVIKFKKTIAILDTTTGQLTKLMDVPYSSSMPLYNTLEVVPSGF